MLQTKEQNTKFYEDLFKMLDEDSDDENVCQITFLPLTDKFVKLECGHCFNYAPLYKEIITQKFFSNTYYVAQLSNKEKELVKKSNVNYFIKCPYCRNIQFSVLPYYPEFNLEEVYGVNSSEKAIKGLSTFESKMSCCVTQTYDCPGLTFQMHKTTFVYGKCSFISSFSDTIHCKCKYVAPIPDTNKSYCTQHYPLAYKQHIIETRKKKLKEQLEKREAKLKLFEEKNAIRVANGLLPLKRLPNIKTIVKTDENVIEGNTTIDTYTSDNSSQCCSAILKTGERKGKQCGSTTVGVNGFCKRHSKSA
jgi:hypothetical protein